MTSRVDLRKKQTAADDDDAAATPLAGLLSRPQDPAEFSKLISQLEEVDVQFADSWTLLVLACYTGNLEAIGQLLAKGADINHLTRDGYSPLIAAVAHGNLEVVQTLLEDDKVEVDLEAPWGATALIRACGEGRSAIVWELIEHDADVNLLTTTGDSALMAAAGGGFVEIVELLTSRGAALDTMNEQGFTALTRAVFHKRLPMVKLLCEKGADPLLWDKNREHKTALEMALRTNNQEIVDVVTAAKKNHSWLKIAKTHMSWELAILAALAVLVALVIFLIKREGIEDVSGLLIDAFAKSFGNSGAGGEGGVKSEL